MTPERYAAAAARHPELARQVDVTIDWDLDNFDESMAMADALITWDLPTADLVDRAPNLKWIHIIGAGIEHLQPLDWLPPGVTLTNNRGVHAEKAGQYGLMALLMLNNAIPRLVGEQQRHNYIECFTTAIGGKTLLVLGAGAMGSAVAVQAKRLGLRTIGIRRTPRDTGGFDEVHPLDHLDDLLAAADFLLVTMPATPETTGLMDSRRLALLAPHAGVINMGRAAVVDYTALAAALTEGALSGAILDVFDPEPLPADSPLWDVPNLVMTPHMSSDDALTYVPRTLDLVFENVGRLVAGEPLQNRVDPALGY
ncbi:MAG: D-2-hydroxyacid dehydrogenase [bacterium]|nr:D-2-hydroxyacid dehydrogenase [bacterium]